VGWGRVGNDRLIGVIRAIRVPSTVVLRRLPVLWAKPWRTHRAAAARCAGFPQFSQKRYVELMATNVTSLPGGVSRTTRSAKKPVDVTVSVR
jgi:hypothetical protein